MAPAPLCRLSPSKAIIGVLSYSKYIKVLFKLLIFAYRLNTPSGAVRGNWLSLDLIQTNIISGVFNSNVFCNTMTLTLSWEGGGPRAGVAGTGQHKPKARLGIQ